MGIDVFARIACNFSASNLDWKDQFVERIRQLTGNVVVLHLSDFHNPDVINSV